MTTNKTLDDYIERAKRRRSTVVRWKANEGWLLMLAKQWACLTGWYHDRVLCDNLIRWCDVANRCFCWLLPQRCQSASFRRAFNDDNIDAGPRFRLALDLYGGIWFAGILASYLISGMMLQSAKRSEWQFEWRIWEAEYGLPVLSFCLVLAAFRTNEIVTFLLLLHARSSYTAQSIIRSLLNTLFLYIQLATAFAILYLVVNVTGDNFGVGCKGRPFGSDLSDAIYFSFATISTLGYGDFSPESSVGKLSVILEVCLGILLLVFVIQRVFAGGGGQKRV